MAAKDLPAVSVHTARPGEAVPPPGDADLTHARATDPDGVFVATDTEGRVLGTASAAVREDTLLLLALDVAAARRGKGVGRTLLAAARAYGAARGTRSLEVLAPDEPSALAFFLSAGLSVRTLVLGMEAGEAPSDPSAPVRGAPLAPVGPGAPLTGWIAALDRETRGFARPRDWGRLAADGHVVSLKRGGRPVAIGAWQDDASGTATALGPIAAKTPEAAADLLPLLAARSPGKRLSLALPAEARMLFLAAGALGFRAVSTRVLLADRRRGDLRRYAGGSGRLF
ncbi:MAG: GNAT family N-acetyltransferase [Thermoanaerobaculia bacterium]|nr:GNAT family N-acetyltransferase [Thermoanaerobaculia bacterium]